MKLANTYKDIQGDLEKDGIYYSWECRVIVDSNWEVVSVDVSYIEAYNAEGEEVQALYAPVEVIKEIASIKAVEQTESSDFDGDDDQ